MREYILEALRNQIGVSSKEQSVTSSPKFNSPKDFKKDSTKVGNIGDFEIHSSPSGAGLTHFTWNKSDRMIHHVVHAAEVTKNGDRTSLKFLSAHSRENSPVKMGEVYAHLVKHHNIDFVGTRHSPGAEKMWKKFHSDPDLKVMGKHPDGSVTHLKATDDHYGDDKSPDPEQKKTAKMHLILTKK